MRASATSRTSAHLHAAQNKPDANKADEASPFALLMQATASKDAAKPSQKDSHASDDKPADDGHAVKKDNKTEDANQAQAKPAQAAKADQATKTDKSEKTDSKTDDKTVKADKQDDAVQDVEAAASQDQAAPPQPQAVNPQIQQAVLPVPAPANDDEGDAEEIAAAGETQNTKAAQQAPQNTPAPAAPATPDEEPAQDAEATAGQALADKAVAAKPAAKPAKTDSAKTDAKTGDIKAAKNANAAENTAAANTADTKADTKADAANAALNDKAAATQDMAASRQANADTNHLAANSLTAPQAQQQPAQAPMTQQVTQHVQMTAQPTPNVAGLAVEIAAKSQSGAKQFDIRLDPPELGRVEVRLSIDATGKASAHLSADQPQTLDLLQKDAPALTRALREAGLDVSQDGLNFSLRHQGGQDGNAHNGGNRGAARSFNLSATTSIDATATSAAYRSVANGRLDIRV